VESLKVPKAPVPKAPVLVPNPKKEAIF